MKHHLHLVFKKKVISSNLEYLRSVDPRPEWEKMPIVLQHVEELIIVTTKIDENPEAIEELYTMRDQIIQLINDPSSYPLDPLAAVFTPSCLNAQACDFIPSPEYIMRNRELCAWYDHYCNILYPPFVPYDYYRDPYYNRPPTL